MIPAYRKAFNDAFTPEKYHAFLRALDEGCGTPIAFRNCETPCFLPHELLERCARYGEELTARLVGDPKYLAAADAAIPAEYRVPNETPYPLFVQADFGLTAGLEPKLVEIQGFPSLYAYQPFLAETYRRVYGLDPALRSYLGEFDDASYSSLLRKVIVAEHAPENVILMEIDPQHQKTVCDFHLTERLCAIQTVDVSHITKRGRRLFYEREGREIPVERIYNRVIVDELARKQVPLAFDFRDDLDVEWAGHPNWYFKISKFSLPYLDHPCVPETGFLDKVNELPADLENYVLKPLFSFAGMGVRIGVTREELLQIPDPAQWALQKRMDFAPVIDTPEGKAKIEIRIMYIHDGELRPVTVLIRMGRGMMMGVDQNKDKEWVGASAAFSP